MTQSPVAAVLRRVRFSMAVLIGMTVVGTLGLRLITGGNWLDCLYLTVITMTTVGYTDQVVPLGTGGKVFLICYLILGIGLFTFSLLELFRGLLSDEFRQYLERRRMQHTIEGLKDHHIVCGLGRMGLTICRQLEQARKPFVVIDRQESAIREHCAPNEWPFVLGDATDDQVLRQAGIERARGLAAVLHTDADNVYVILTARLLSERVEIVARAGDEKARAKMERAGATRVVSPYSAGATKIARFLLNPNVEDFLEIADRKGQGLELADVVVPKDSPFIGKRLMETDLSNRGVIIVGIRRASGERLMPPRSDTVIEPGDCLFAFGSTEGVNAIIAETQ